MNIADWEIFFVGARTLIGKRETFVRGTSERLAALGASPERSPVCTVDKIAPVYELLRVPSERGIATTIFPVGWFPVDSLPVPADALAFPISKLGSAERRQLANGVQKAEEMLQQMRAAASGLAIAKDLPK